MTDLSLVKNKSRESVLISGEIVYTSQNCEKEIFKEFRLTDAGLEKKVRHRTVCPFGDISLRASFDSAPRFSKKFKRENSHGP